MRINRPTRIAHGIALTVLFAAWIGDAADARPTPLTMAFTYQGLLKNSGAPVSGTVDLEFRLFDADVAGGQIGATLTVNTVAVAEGIFTQSLDFGALAFNGQERWLQVSVNGTPLTPRQKLATTPYAAYALNASLSGPYANAVDFSNASNLFAGSFTGSGAGLTNLNPASLTAGTAGINISGNAATATSATTATTATTAGNVSGIVALTNGGTGASSAAAALANLGAAPASHSHVLSSLSGALAAAQMPTGGAWTLTTDLNIDSNTLFVDSSSAEVGIGTATPNANLEVVRNLASNITPMAIFRQAGTRISGVDSIQNSANNHFNLGITAANDFALGAFNGNISQTGDLLRITSAGNTGLGTPTPMNRLDIEGGAAIGAAYSGSTAAPANGLIVEGDVGIGVLAPAAKLHVSGPNIAVQGVSSGLNSRGVYGLNTATTDQSYGVYGENASTSGRGVFGAATAVTGLTIGGKFENQSTSGIGALGTAAATTGANTGVWGETLSTIGRGVYGLGFTSTGINYGVYGASNSTSGRALNGIITATSGINYGLYADNPSSGGRGIYGFASAASGTTYGGRFENNSTSGRGMAASALADTGFTYAVRGENASTSGVGVYGLAYATSGETYGVLGRCDSPIGYAVSGTAAAATGINYGGFFESDSVEGRGVFGTANSTTGSNYGGRFQSPSTSGRGVLGWATATTGDSYGVQGQCDSNSGIGVFGVNIAASGLTYGVLGESDSTSGHGVHGRGTATSGFNYGTIGESDSSSGRGVYGRANSAVGTVYGVYGENDNGAGGYAVFADGDMGSNGLKTFRIDHPDDPANKYLIHYAAESDEVINFYSGKVTLNGAGEAVVDLPPYFAKINRDPRYTLTAIGAPMPSLHVADEISDGALQAGEVAEPGQAAPVCWFRIAGGVPGAKVSWEVKAVRNDRWARLRGAPVEVDKVDLERGTYQHPELYGQPAQAALGYIVEHAPRPRGAINEEPMPRARPEDAATTPESPGVPTQPGTQMPDGAEATRKRD